MSDYPRVVYYTCPMCGTDNSFIYEYRGEAAECPYCKTLINNSYFREWE